MESSGFSGHQSTWFGRLEWAVAGLLTAAAIILQVVNFRHAGGLWRDEVAAVNLAQMPTWADIFAHLEHESFPLLITVMIRIWTALGFGGSDAGLRALGFVISIGMLAALWWASWRLTRRPPLLALVLIALSPVAVRWGGSLRAYGLGVLLMVVAVAAVWQLIERRSWRYIAFASIACVLAVHALYQNALVVFAICSAAGAIAAMRRDWKLAASVAAVGAVAALSLLPYIGVVTRASEWNEATAVAIDLERIWTVLHRALSASGAWVPWIWGALLLGAIAATILIVTGRGAQESRAGDRSIYVLGTTVVTAVAYYAFLKLTKFPTEEWYYLLLMAEAALAIEAVIASASRAWPWHLLRMTCVAIAAAIMLPTSLRAVEVRATNLDVVATRLSAAAAAGDVIIVQPWFSAVTFARYYSGPAEALTLPPLSDQKLQRLDLFKAQLRNQGALQPVLEKMETTMRSGGTVWLVGHFPFTNPPRPPPVLPRAGEGPEGWRGAPYMAAYGAAVAYFIQMNATQSSPFAVSVDLKVHPFEDLPVRAVSGWRRSRGGW